MTDDMMALRGEQLAHSFLVRDTPAELLERPDAGKSLGPGRPNDNLKCEILSKVEWRISCFKALTSFG